MGNWPNNPAARYTAVVIDLNCDEKKEDADGFRILKEAITDTYLEPIIFTGRGSEARVIQAMDLCAFKYIVKTSRTADPDAESDESMVDTTQLVVAIRRAAERRRTVLEIEARLRTGSVTIQDADALIHDPVEGVRFRALRSSRVRTRSCIVW